MFKRIRSTVREDRNGEASHVEKEQDTAKYSLSDLSRKELVMIFQDRESEKSRNQITNIFYGCMAAGFILAIMLVRVHNIWINLTSFLPIIAYFVLSSRRNRKIAKIVRQKIGQAIVDRAFNKPNEGGPVTPIRG